MKPPWNEHALWQNPITSVESAGADDATLRLEPYPGSIGGRVAGTITLPQEASVEGSFILRLSCVSNLSTSHDAYANDHLEILWANELQTTPSSVRSRMSIAFAFDQVPANLPESELPLGGSYVEWRLSLTASTGATKLHHTFLIPVFETDLYGKRPASSISKTEMLLASWRDQKTWQPYRTEVSLETDTLVVRHGPWRGGLFQPSGTKGFFTVFILLVLSVTLLIFGNEEPVVKFVTGIFGSLGLLTTALAAYLWVRTVEIRALPGRLTRVCRMFGRTIQTQTLSADKISAFFVRDDVLYVDTEELGDVLELIDSIHDHELLNKLRRLLVDSVYTEG